MKRTFTVNLNNTVYHIDNDAYELLQQYMAEVESRLSPDERKEVMADIETRISELFSERLQKGKNVINIEDVEEVINILGKPNQFNEAEEAEQKATPKSDKKFKRKYYRDTDNAVLGGVAAGLAALLGWDVVLVRVLLIVISLTVYGTIIPIYLIVWLIAPPARTISQKLEMQGEDVTAERIKAEINNVKNYVESDKFKESATGVGNKLAEVFRAFFKIVFGFIGAIMGFVGFIMLGVLLVVLSFLIFEPSIFTGISPELSIFTPEKAVLMIIALMFIVGIPIFMLIYWAIKIISGKRDKSGALGWVMIILWFLSIFMFAGLGARTALTLSKGDFDSLEFYWSNDDDDKQIAEMRHLEPFHGVEVSGNIEIELVQDSIQSVQVRCHPDVLGHVRTEVENGILKIYTKKIHLNRNIKVNVTGSTLQQLTAHGAAEINSYGKISSDRMHIELSGVSKADLDVAVSQDLVVEMNGATNADIEGHAYNLSCDLSGASKLDAENLQVRNADISGTGVCEIEADVKDSLEVEMSGASHFKTNNRPIYLQQKVMGGSSVTIN